MFTGLRVITPVTAKSTNQEIVDAIDEAGNFRNPSRIFDHPREVETKSWVIPREIGVIEKGDKSLVERLLQMGKDGILEVSYYSILKCRSKEKDNNPRFRVKEQA